MNWSYIAGFFDCEGCISESAQNTDGNAFSRDLRVSMSQQRREVLDEINLFLSQCGIPSRVWHTKHPPKYPGQMFLLVVVGTKDARKFLSAIYHLLIVKRNHAEDAIRRLIIYPPIPSTVRAMLRDESRRRNAVTL